ncbi:SCO family protein [Azonexus hydrophilus]|jgi:protein SCO1|uniref:SCO family protein n=1 Tax=Azonexus hydrophilus TaxID=418702 RepID=UPI00175FCCF4|nr:SCO family protein [Azonexus hydrophilus]HHV47583.1 SCO family protein [Rhodocyclaceae bacterium]
MKRRVFCATLAALPFLAHTLALAASPHTTFDLEPRSINPRYLLIGPQGSAVSNEDFRGRFQLITFGYTFCPDICPTTLVDMAETLKLLGEDAQRVQAIFISVDPDRDTPQQLATYTDFFDKRIIGLTGSPALIQAAARNFKVRYEKVIKENQDPRNYAVDHSAGLYLLGPEGAFIKKFAYATPADSMASEIRQLLHTH